MAVLPGIDIAELVHGLLVEAVDANILIILTNLKQIENAMNEHIASENIYEI